jgi:hypothetical protein
VDYVAVGDLNKDGHLDVVSVNHLTSQVNILLGNGDGTLQSAVPYSTGSSPRSVTVADVNNDGDLDLITANGTRNGTNSVLLGNGDGTFGPHVEFTIGGEPFLNAVGDFNKDGKPDILSSSKGSLKLQLLLGNGDGTFQTPKFVASFDGTYGLVIADFNQDGNLDFAASGLGSVAVFLGNGTGTFPTENDLFLFSSTMLAAGDVNGDGKIDLVGGGAGASVLLGNGDGTFKTPTYYGSLNGDSFVALADVSGRKRRRQNRFRRHPELRNPGATGCVDRDWRRSFPRTSRFRPQWRWRQLLSFRRLQRRRKSGRRNGYQVCVLHQLLSWSAPRQW